MIPKSRNQEELLDCKVSRQLYKQDKVSDNPLESFILLFLFGAGVAKDDQTRYHSKGKSIDYVVHR